MPVTIKDLERLAAETIELSEPEAFMERYGIPFETIQALTAMANLTFTDKFTRTGDFHQSFGEVVANIFIIGWLAGEQMGGQGRERVI